MKKTIIIALAVTVITGLFSISNAADIVRERPDINVTIDCVTKSYTNTPIIVNGRTMLPLRELLINLGVPNDDQHIIWNSSEKSVKAIKDNIELKLKVGSVVADKNGNEVFLDAAPVNYKGSIYIPARFAAESFGKVVVWDKDNGQIYIRDKKEFDEIKDIINKAGNQMDESKRFILDSYFSMSASDGPEKLTITKHDEIDKENKIMYANKKTDLVAFVVETQFYLEGKILNTRVGSSSWERTELTNEEYDFLWDTANFDNLIGKNDIMYSSLSLNKTSDKVSLKGSIYVPISFGETSSDKELYKSNVEFEIDRDGFLKKFSADCTYQDPKDEKDVSTKVEMTYTFSDYNKNSMISKPEGL